MHSLLKELGARVQVDPLETNLVNTTNMADTETSTGVQFLLAIIVVDLDPIRSLNPDILRERHVFGALVPIVILRAVGVGNGGFTCDVSPEAVELERIF